MLVSNKWYNTRAFIYLIIILTRLFSDVFWYNKTFEFWICIRICQLISKLLSSTWFHCNYNYQYFWCCGANSWAVSHSQTCSLKSFIIELISKHTPHILHINEGYGINKGTPPLQGITSHLRTNVKLLWTVQVTR